MSTTLPPAPIDARRARLRECTLLLVDDEPSNLDLLEGVLEAEGYTKLVRTTDPRDVLSLAATHEPDLILLDLHMPHRNGLEVLGDLAAHTVAGEYRPVLVLTADATVSARDRALSLGARDFVTKPFDVTEVVLRVENLLDTRVLHLEERSARRRAEAAEAQALEALAEAQLATSERERLLAVVSHDLRNPLGAIAMYAEVLSNLQPDIDPSGSESEQRVRAYARTALGTIHTSAAAMQRLVQDLLEASTLKGGAFRMMRAPVPARTPADDAIRMLVPRAEAAGVRLELDADYEVVAIDGPRLTQLLGNLIANAIAVTPRDGVVRVKLTVADNGTTLHGSVSDTGPGIPFDVMPHLFTAFWRGDRRDRNGVGLGLWIARAIAEGHGGDLTAVSIPGSGAIFSFTLPLADRERRPED
ncbi:hybrid sensor histidine kinase/response regulator [Gemmatimonas groenlandica]|uniref:histidine kinase n=1 Tax=Gemmatimonas groenlandica TaxID=2732249 RepID=A0A6M4IRX5_9BACT|nr:hybrid sensor histidine kinase/response regulator [Gemmatimonas groenlandica]QJR37523.1 hybrid sensor histidine kinase/response regulator [Gemmatimonas groenlandica]